MNGPTLRRPPGCASCLRKPAITASSQPIAGISRSSRHIQACAGSPEPGRLLLPGLLLFLQSLLLLNVSLLQLFHLLLSCFAFMVLRQPLMFLILLLLQFLALLLLLCKHFLLLLVVTIAIRVACAGSSGTLERRQVFRMDRAARRPVLTAPRLSRVTIGRRVVRRSGLSCGHCGVKLCWPDRSGDGRLAVVGGGSQLRVAARSLEMLRLYRHRRDMPLARR